MSELGIEFDKKHFKEMVKKYEINSSQNLIEAEEEVKKISEN